MKLRPILFALSVSASMFLLAGTAAAQNADSTQQPAAAPTAQSAAPANAPMASPPARASHHRGNQHHAARHHGHHRGRAHHAKSHCTRHKNGKCVRWSHPHHGKHKHGHHHAAPKAK
ncbi:MAG: hypothetical protein JSR34_00590 [Proteobacteria bacterium]|nr:hypothetical protein [Pseudomonadota bacterium]